MFRVGFGLPTKEFLLMSALPWALDLPLNLHLPLNLYFCSPHSSQLLLCLTSLLFREEVEGMAFFCCFGSVSVLGRCFPPESQRWGFFCNLAPSLGLEVLLFLFCLLSLAAVDLHLLPEGNRIWIFPQLLKAFFFFPL